MSLENLTRQFKSTAAHVLALSNDQRAAGTTIEAIKAEIEKLSEKLAAVAVGSGTSAAADAKKPDPMLQAFAVFARNGSSRPQNFHEFIKSGDGREVIENLGIQAAATTQSNPDGGFLSMPQVESRILEVARDYSPMRELATVQPISRGEWKVLVDPSVMEAKWAGETEERPETVAKKLAEITIPAEEIYANPMATATLIDNSMVNIANWFSDGASKAFALKEGTAFVSGDGIEKPRGFLTYPTASIDDFVRDFGSIQYVATGSTSPTNDQLAAAIVALSMKLRAPYRANAVWQMSRSVAAVVRQLKDANGLLLWATDSGRYVDGVPEKLLGFPVRLNEDFPQVGANSFPIALGDWKSGYTIVNRKGVTILRDPYSNKPYVGFYTTKRVGGGMVNYNAIKLLKIAAS